MKLLRVLSPVTPHARALRRRYGRRRAICWTPWPSVDPEALKDEVELMLQRQLASCAGAIVVPAAASKEDISRWPWPARPSSSTAAAAPSSGSSWCRGRLVNVVVAHGATLLQAGVAVVRRTVADCPWPAAPAPQFAFKSIALSMPATGLGVELRRQLEGTGTLQVLAPGAAGADKADVVMGSPGEQRERTVVSFHGDRRGARAQLRIRFRFRLRTPEGRELLPMSEDAPDRPESHSESAALSKEQEALMLYQNLQSDIVQQMRRLATVKT